ncbi:hypothetical protein ALC57_02055, partial [Trachymyrmex cornetzi]
RVRFELLTDIDMIIFIERGIRGGLSQCSGRYAQANNKYMRSYDPSEPLTYLMYYDVNTLYGWAMCQPLPYAEFQWVKDVANFDVSAIAPDSPIGYILEVDLEYPQHLDDVHADLPFCPTRDKPPGKREDKLLATVYDKKRYVIQYRNLQQCTRHGLRVTKIHENVRNHVDVKLLTKWDGRYGAEAMIAKPTFHSRSIFAENLIAVELRKLEVKFNKLPGLMKDENNGMIMTEFVGLRAKMYALKVDGKRTHIDGPAPKIKDCSECQRRAVVC